MAKFQCVCGELIRTSGGIPNDQQWMLMSDVDFDGWEEGDSVENLYRAMTLMFRCPTSDHLWVFWDGIESRPSLYEPQPHHGVT